MAHQHQRSPFLSSRGGEPGFRPCSVVHRDGTAEKSDEGRLCQLVAHVAYFINKSLCDFFRGTENSNTMCCMCATCVRVQATWGIFLPHILTCRIHPNGRQTRAKMPHLTAGKRRGFSARLGLHQLSPSPTAHRSGGAMEPGPADPGWSQRGRASLSPLPLDWAGLQFHDFKISFDFQRE